MSVQSVHKIYILSSSVYKALHVDILKNRLYKDHVHAL